jgi:hypothetical protein
MPHRPDLYRSILEHVRREAAGRDRTLVAFGPDREPPLGGAGDADAHQIFEHVCDLWEAGMIEVLTGRKDALPRDAAGRPKQLFVGGLTDEGRAFLEAASGR